MSRRPRDLRADERLLWQEVMRQVRPLPGRDTPAGRAAPPVERPAVVEAPAPPRPAPAGPPSARPVRPPSAPPSVRTAPPLAPLERRAARALARGRREAEATVDLHGLTQADAHAVLARFLHGAQRDGLSLVQVVTGKGRAGAIWEERGVLRRMVPHWLALPGMRTLVIGFEEAAPHRGGSGALYVRLRRRPGA